MGLADKHKAAHVRSAKKWLEKAEQSFDNQSTVKGELNLMLAEAEMKNLRKQRGTRSRLRTAAIGLLCMCCLCGTLWMQRHTEANRSIPIKRQPVVETQTAAMPEPMPAATQQETTMSDTSRESDSMTISRREERPVDTPMLQVETDRHVSSEVTTSPPVAHKTVPPAKPVLTERQMQEAVQDARRSLRGTTIQNK